MRKKLFREALIFGAVAFAMALLLHPDLLSDPQERFYHMIQRENIGHPFVYTALVYGILWLLRSLFSFIRRLLFSRT
ncbi:hypothetical protein Sulku_2004 [Sulfuricurvum kujiense DSM 16994]|uniref:Uncharacterized protein n=1 Tax=Sulfuricurvum kujiense (strain ATCC BAA-921 / DSM 16994 / JCM 11577 / YK-1) TaxID=709032 RepID=E4U2H7_SULKY|nr:hypothetical protein [Sulfuricurvum kujiense]ADR34664.1 hypothetical protein Sulku_2004 [Sulfuricurvum kujiense DSM 16994]